MSSRVKTGRLPLITVAMPTRNNASTIGAVLSSLESQDYPKKRIQVVFVDGVSTDGTIRRITSWMKRKKDDYSEISFESEESNIPKARNQCLRKAKGELILFWDADVVAPSEAIGSLLRRIRRRNVAMANYTYDSEKPGLVDKVLRLEKPAKVSYVKSVVMGFTLIRKSIIKKVGYFNENLDAFEDQEFSRRVTRAKFAIVMDPSVRLRHLKKPYTLRQFIRDNFSRRSKYVNALVKEGSRIHVLRAIYYILLPLGFLAGAVLAEFFSWRIGICILKIAFVYMLLSIIWHLRGVRRSSYGLLSPLVYFIGGIALGYGMLWHAVKEK